MLGSSGEGGWGRGNLGLLKPLGRGLGPHGAFLTGFVGFLWPSPLCHCLLPNQDSFP